MTTKRQKTETSSGVVTGTAPASGPHLKCTATHAPFFKGGKVVYLAGGAAFDNLVCCASLSGSGVAFVETRFGKVVTKVGEDEISTFAIHAAYTGGTSKSQLAATRTATISRKGLVRIFRTTFGETDSNEIVTAEMKSWATLHTGPVTEASFDAGGELLATGSTDFTVRVWSVSGGYATHNFKSAHRAAVTVVRFNPLDSARLCSADASGEIYVWDLNTKAGTPLRNHLSAVTDVGFAPNFGLVSVGRDHVISLWSAGKNPLLVETNDDTEKKKKKKKHKSKEDTTTTTTTYALVKTIPAMESLEGVAVMTNKEHREIHFITCGMGGRLKRWRFTPHDRECLVMDAAVVLSAKDKPLSSVHLSRNESTVMVVDEIETSFSFRSTARLSLPTAPSLVGFDDEINDVAFLGSPGRLLVGANSGVMRIYDLVQGGVELLTKHAHEEEVLAVKFHPGVPTPFFVSASKDQTVKLWRAHPPACAGVGTAHTDPVTCVTVANAGTAAFSGGADGMLCAWWVNPASLGDAKKKSTAGTRARSGSSSSSSSLLGIEEDDDVVPAPLAPLECLYHRAAHSKALTDLAVSPKDTFIATCSLDKTCRIWSLALLPATGGRISLKISRKFELVGHRRAVTSVSFSPADRVVCTASADHTLRVWSLLDGTCVRTLQGHSSAVTSCLFLPDVPGFVASCASDGSMRTWNLKTSTCTQTIGGGEEDGVTEGSSESHLERISSVVAWIPPATSETSEGNVIKDYALMTGSIDGVVKLWKDCAEEEAMRKVERERAEVAEREALERSVRAGRTLEAARLAMKLNRPHQLRVILESAKTNGVAEGGESGDITSLVARLLGLGKRAENLEEDARSEERRKEDALMFLNAVRGWNTVARTCVIAQRCLAALLVHADEFAKLVGKGQMRSLVNGCAPYTERHLRRVDKLAQSTYLLEHALERCVERSGGVPLLREDEDDDERGA